MNDTVNSSEKGLEEDLSDEEKVILNMIRDGKKYTKQDFMTAIGKSPKTVQRYLNHMTELGLIRREGSTRNGQWIAVE